jgi:hypothetical protein
LRGIERENESDGAEFEKVKGSYRGGGAVWIMSKEAEFRSGFSRLTARIE